MILLNSGKTDGVDHNKFWIATISDDGLIVHTKWGRVGTSGQSKDYSFPSKREAERFLDSKVYDKMRGGGYTVIQEPQFKRLQATAAVIGSKNKVTDVQWVEIMSGNKCKEIPEQRLGSPECLPGIRVKFSLPDNSQVHYLMFTMSGSDLEAKYSYNSLGPFVDLPDMKEVKTLASKILNSLSEIGL